MDRILLTYVEEMSSSSCRKRRLKAAALIAAKQQADDPDSSDLVPDDDGAVFEETVSRSSAPLAPVRDCHKLFAATTTLNCAWKSGCVACAYKIATFDVALDFSFCKRIPNQRPELCPRCRPSTAGKRITTNITAGADVTANVTARTGAGVPARTAPPPVSIPGLYRPTMRVLTVGDGDFSFSLALARFGCHVTATSYETKETVLRVYQSIGVEATLSELEKDAGPIAFSVDATNLRETLPILDGDDQKQFDRIVWNFPCSAVAKGQDGQNQEMEHNKELVRRFVDNARNFLSSNGHGQIHINHKTKPPFNQWKLEEVAMSAAPNNVRYLGRVVLDRGLFPPYVPRKALDRKSFPCHDACTYIFDVVQDNTTTATTMTTTTTTTTRNPLDATTISDPLEVLVENNVWLSSSSSKGSLVAVTPALIQSLRARFLQQQQDEERPVSTLRRKKGRRRR